MIKPFPQADYNCILADPPWPLTLTGKYASRKRRNLKALPYPTMTITDIMALPVAQVARQGAHLWLWTTNQFLKAGFDVMDAWGFKYLAPIHWLKPSGLGNYFVHLTQTLLFGYKEKCRFPKARYLKNIIQSGLPLRHSRKPEASYDLIMRVSPGPYLELFARQFTPLMPVRPGWDAWGNEI